MRGSYTGITLLGGHRQRSDHPFHVWFCYGRGTPEPPYRCPIVVYDDFGWVGFVFQWQPERKFAGHNFMTIAATHSHGTDCLRWLYVSHSHGDSHGGQVLSALVVYFGFEGANRFPCLLCHFMFVILTLFGSDCMYSRKVHRQYTDTHVCLHVSTGLLCLLILLFPSANLGKCVEANTTNNCRY